MKDFEPFNEYSAYDHSKPVAPSFTSDRTQELLKGPNTPRYFRAEVAKAALQGLLTRDFADLDWACEQAVRAADTLIQKLKQKR